ncbi:MULTISPECIES: cupin domain-containing protein [unclassified Nocardioides]|uniref:cupin domain-containing protein n=1 Tax=unclassified Nocardioides TaxID=2615069 RepID=UPI0012E3A26F|nr:MULTISPECIES: cupin domain-containing protein [unclassified Nocardioides]
MTDRNAAEAPRRVVVGLGADGRSTTIADEVPAATVTRPGGMTITELWRADELPAAMGEMDALRLTTVPANAPAGLAVRICTFPPDEVRDRALSQGHADANTGRRPASDASRAGMHRTDTVDVVTVIRGELTVVTETGETTLRAGDSVVQMGTMHAWSNRTNETVVAIAIMTGGR